MTATVPFNYIGDDPEPLDAPSPKTREEIEYLKRDWLSDPCYDLESVEGFEWHHEELLELREEHEAKWQQQRADEIKEMSARWECSEATAVKIESLQYQLDRLESLVARLEDRLCRL